ncbi:DUF6522 family protein [Algihabitans albus]|uniref:DUF6522 family protein n=1 Tax=Algihabitans albus TaxID=2164067 RepID=UPI000E5D6217|nr:DUF6522 family protein [Algihabitans albus]
MSQLPSKQVVVSEGQITIEAGLLAPKLGLSAERLKDKMTKGLVTSIAETGVGEDVGRTRLTFFYRAKIWRVVVKPDGTLEEDPLRLPEPRAAKDRPSLLDLVADL